MTRRKNTKVSKRKRAKGALRKGNPTSVLGGIAKNNCSELTTDGYCRALFEDSPLSLWLEDLSPVKKYLERLQASGIDDIEAYLKAHPEVVKKCVALVKVLDVNRATLELYQTRSKRVFLGGLPRFSVKESYEAYREELIAIARGQTSCAVETVFCTAKREIKHAAVRWAALTGFEGTLGRVLVYVVDITHRKQVEEALQKAEADYRSIFENAMEGIFQTDVKGRFLMANPAMAHIFGYDTPEELIEAVTDIGKQLYVEPARRKELIRWLRHHGFVWGFESQHYRKDGKAIWTLANIHAVRDSRGRLRYFEGIVQDITARKKAEEELRLLSGRLLVAQDQERRHIARGLHESTAQDLVALALNLGTLGKRAAKLDPQSRKVLSKSLLLATKCAREIRTLSHLLHPPELEGRDLGSAVREYVEDFALHSGIALRVSTPRRFDLLPLELEVTLFRVVQESVTNIHRHAKSRTGKIRLFYDKKNVGVEIRDDGVGMPAEIRKQINRGETGVPPGVGIAGLRERIHQFGGKLVIASNGGTTVRVTIPHREREA